MTGSSILTTAVPAALTEVAVGHTRPPAVLSESAARYAQQRGVLLVSTTGNQQLDLSGPEPCG